MGISLKVIENTSTFHRKVCQAICDEFNSKFRLITQSIRDGIASKIAPVFRNTDEYRYLTSDTQIMADMGLPRGEESTYLDAVIQRIADSIEVSFITMFVSNSNITGGFDIDILISDFSDVLALKQAKIPSVGGVNDWLNWILLDGASIEVAKGYHVEYGKFGRSGYGHMVLGGVWTVDPKVQGTINNNWLTKALDTNETLLKSIILDVVETEIERVL